MTGVAMVWSAAASFTGLVSASPSPRSSRLAAKFFECLFEVRCQFGVSADDLFVGEGRAAGVSPVDDLDGQ